MKPGAARILDANPQVNVTKLIFSGQLLRPDNSKNVGNRLAHILR